MYKVFFNDRIVFINSADDRNDLLKGQFSKVLSASEAQLAWQNFSNDSSKSNLYLTGHSDEEVLQLFMKNFKVIHAAGGLVFNGTDQLLCIYRWNKWDLPKGKVEKNEHVEAAAVREVEEETGISGVKIESFKTITYHIYESPYHKNKMVLKPTHWFNMKYEGTEMLTPQIKEDIVKAQWFDKNKIDEVKHNTYASLKELFEF